MKGAILRLIGLRPTTAILMLVIVVMVNALVSPYFFVPFNLSNVASASVEIGLLALPATLLITAGEIDLSIASTLALSAAVLAVTSQSGAPWYAAIGAALLTGAVAGLVNGVLVTRFGLSSIVVTIGTLALFRGLTQVILGDRTVQHFPTELTGWNLQFVGDSLVTWPQLFLVISAAVFAVILGLTRAGRLIKLIGSAPDVARFSGVQVGKAKVLLFVLSGVFSAIAAVFLVSRLQAARNDIGLGLELVAITAVLIGGTDLRGGRGTIWGTFIALAVVGAVTSGLRLANAPDQVGLAVVGGLLIVAILAATFRDYIESSLVRRHPNRPSIAHNGERGDPDPRLARRTNA